MRFRVDIDVFGYSVYFFFGIEESNRFIKDTGVESVDFSSSGFTSNNASWIKNDNDMGSIIHESHHLKKFLVDRLGIKDEETEAYLITYIVEETAHKIQKIKAKEKNGGKETVKSDLPDGIELA